MPANLTFTDNGNGTGTLSGTPAPGTGGVYNLTFTASNGINRPVLAKGYTDGLPVGTMQNSAALTVNEAPSITSANSVSYIVGNFGSFNVTAEGFPAPTFSATGALPSGVTFVNGLLSGTPGVQARPASTLPNHRDQWSGQR